MKSKITFALGLGIVGLGTAAQAVALNGNSAFDSQGDEDTNSRIQFSSGGEEGEPPSASLTESYSFTEFGSGSNASLDLPDGSASGVVDSRNVTSAITYIESVTVSLNLTSEWNGDLYVYLVHNDGLSVLLNRVGRTAGNSFGYGDSGMDVTFADGSANGDIHEYRMTLTPGAGDQLTGTWDPDGRLIDPAFSLDTVASTAGLGVFTGGNANGEWTLFLADMHGGGMTQLQSWGMTITGIPEPTTWSLLVAGFGMFAYGQYRLRQRGK